MNTSVTLDDSRLFNLEYNSKQEGIPVGCVLPAHYHTGGLCLGGLCPGGSLSGGLCLGGLCSGGLLGRGVSV